MTSPGNERFDEHLVREAAAALPPRRNDEPASLRQDILDELGDHLACAYRRELLRTGGDAPRSQRNVRDRFGSPSGVARRLWFDAMKGTIMAQRMLVGICALLAACCLMLGLLLWRTMGRLDEYPKDPEWNPMTVRCVTGFDEGPPLGGVKVRLSPRGDALGPQATVTTTADGHADFGLRRTGTYGVHVTTPWEERLSQNVSVQPGRPSDTVIVCPVRAPHSVRVDWEVTWPDPEPIMKSGLWYVVHFRADLDRETTGEAEWEFGTDDRLLAFHPGGRVIDLAISRGGKTIPPRVRQSIERIRRDGRRPMNPQEFWAGYRYEATSAGLFRWDGEGPAAEMLGDTFKVVKRPGHGSAALQWVDENWFTDKWEAVEQRTDLPQFTADAVGGMGSSSKVIWRFTVPKETVAEAIERMNTASDKQP